MYNVIKIIVIAFRISYGSEADPAILKKGGSRIRSGSFQLLVFDQLLVQKGGSKPL